VCTPRRFVRTPTRAQKSKCIYREWVVGVLAHAQCALAHSYAYYAKHSFRKKLKTSLKIVILLQLSHFFFKTHQRSEGKTIVVFILPIIVEKMPDSRGTEFFLLQGSDEYFLRFPTQNKSGNFSFSVVLKLIKGFYFLEFFGPKIQKCPI
jgi:hypothetical protein